MIPIDIIAHNLLRLNVAWHTTTVIIDDNTDVNILVPINFNIKSFIFIFCSI